MQAILDLVAQCLNRDTKWQAFHANAVQNIGADQPSMVDYTIASAELRAWTFAQEGQYPRAAEELARLINNHSDLTEIDQGWYLQLQAGYLHHSDRVAALEKQVKALPSS